MGIKGDRVSILGRRGLGARPCGKVCRRSWTVWGHRAASQNRGDR